jgi:hypothetical protein
MKLDSVPVLIPDDGELRHETVLTPSTDFVRECAVPEIVEDIDTLQVPELQLGEHDDLDEGDTLFDVLVEWS